MTSRDYQVVWASGVDPLLYGYVVSFGTVNSINLVRAFLFDSRTSKRVGEVNDYIVADYATPDALADEIENTLRKDGADVIVYFTKAFSLDDLDNDLKLNLPFPRIRNVDGAETNEAVAGDDP